jgi:hypothetical protein
MSEAPTPKHRPEIEAIWANKSKAQKIIHIVWFLGCVIAGTIVGALIGWAHYGGLGAFGVGLLGLIIGGIFGAAPSLLAEFLGAALSK